MDWYACAMPTPAHRAIALALAALALLLLTACQSTPRHAPGTFAYTRAGDEIMVAGQLFHTGAPVVLWTDPGGYDAYRTERRFGPIGKVSWEATRADGRGPSEPARYGTRFFRFAATQPASWWGNGGQPLAPDLVARVRGGGWDLPALQAVVDQFVLHYDVSGISKACFQTLHDSRGLSVHFLLDIDGTIYQTLDLKERAFHATVSNDRSIGIEIANMGAYSTPDAKALREWYKPDESGRVRIVVPERFGDPMIRTPNFVGRPDRPDPVAGPVQGKTLHQYDLTPQQYDSLIKLTAALCTVFPNMACDYPRDADGRLLTAKLPDDQLRAFRGILGHYHVQDDKQDPGPALQWDRLIIEARRLMPHRHPSTGTPLPPGPAARPPRA